LWRRLQVLALPKAATSTTVGAKTSRLWIHQLLLPPLAPQGLRLKSMRLTNPTYHFAAEFAEVGRSMGLAQRTGDAGFIVDGVGFFFPDLRVK